MQHFLVYLKPFILYLQEHPYFHSILILAILIISLRLLISMRSKTSSSDYTDKDIHTIAGENISSTQLDLAKAYLEMGQTKAAKKALKQVRKLGDKTQRVEAKQLMKSC